MDPSWCSSDWILLHFNLRASEPGGVASDTSRESPDERGSREVPGSTMRAGNTRKVRHSEYQDFDARPLSDFSAIFRARGPILFKKVMPSR